MIKRLQAVGCHFKSTPQNEQLAEELHKPIIRKIGKRRMHSAFKDNIRGADLADMQLISKFNKGFRFLLCVIDIFSKYAWVVPLKEKKGVSIVNTFQKVLKQSNRKPNKIWVGKGSEFYNNSFKKWLQNNNIAMYSTRNEGKSVVAERFVRTLKSSLKKCVYRGYFRIKLSPISGCCPQGLIFFKTLFYQKNCKEVMNIWGGEIRGALFNFFVVKKCPFVYLPDAVLSF